MRISMIAGLPGSGKSRLLADLAGEGAAIVDDPTAIDDLPKGPVRWLAVASGRFCCPETRKASQATMAKIYPEAAFEWTFFENDPRTCRRNIRRRADGRTVPHGMPSFAASYVIPEGADVRPVQLEPFRNPASGG